MTVNRVFIAGTMQGANAGLTMEDQSYRPAIREILHRVASHVEVFDPSEEVQRLLSGRAVREAVGHATTGTVGSVRTADLPAPVQEIREAFLRMTREASLCSLCIAYLPGRKLSMGTAMEMYQAHLASVPIIAVTSLIGNLAIGAVSTWIVPDLDALEALLKRDASSLLSREATRSRTSDTTEA